MGKNFRIFLSYRQAYTTIIMLQTFLFRTDTADKTYHHTIHSTDIKAAIDTWLRQIENLQNQVYSFNSGQVQNIHKQHLNGQMKVHVNKEPYFLTIQLGDTHQIVHIDKIDKGDPDFTAIITYLTTEQGGRIGYAASGYRPHVKFDGRKDLTTGEQLFVDKDKVFPGETVTAEVRILGVELFKNYLFVGQHFEVAEASHLVGHGQILQVINPDLRQASR